MCLRQTLAYSLLNVRDNFLPWHLWRPTYYQKQAHWPSTFLYIQNSWNRINMDLDFSFNCLFYFSTGNIIYYIKMYWVLFFLKFRLEIMYQMLWIFSARYCGNVGTVLVQNIYDLQEVCQKKLTDCVSVVLLRGGKHCCVVEITDTLWRPERSPFGIRNSVPRSVL